jgi:2-pyrone-4,6-dicarboxylate lactonase
MAKLTRGPDPKPKKPRLALPPGACDTHIHLFGPVEKYPYAPDTPYHAHDATAEMFFTLQEQLGLSTAVIVSPGAYGRSTTMLTDALTAYPDRFRGIALMADDTPSPEFARLGKLGVRGMRMMSHRRGPHVPHFNRETAARAHEHGWHVQFYPHDNDIVDYADKLLSAPNDIVLDHFADIPAAGGVDQPAMKTVLKMLDTGRVWVKLSAPMRSTPEDYPYAAVTPLAHALVRHAPERLVWATDWPHVNLDGREMVNDGDLVDQIADWIPDAATRRRILVDNANKLYGFP